MRTDGRERPGRLATSATAAVYMGNERFVARLVTLSASGAVIIPSVEGRPGAFVRLNLALAGLPDLVDIDAVLVEETMAHQWYAWRLEFHQPREALVDLIRRYVARARQAMKSGERLSPPAKPVDQTGPAHAIVDRDDD